MSATLLNEYGMVWYGIHRMAAALRPFAAIATALHLAIIITEVIITVTLS